MRGWMMAAEPTLEELLRDDIMVSVTRTPGSMWRGCARW
jgi:hypothetical protein